MPCATPHSGGGKRLRAFLVIESARMFSVSETCAARVAASVEMLHAYSLVHDDLPAMDDDDLRRGKPVLHKAPSMRRPPSWPEMPCKPEHLRFWPIPIPTPIPRRGPNSSLAFAAAVGRARHGRRADDRHGHRRRMPWMHRAVTRLQASKTGQTDPVQCRSRRYPWPRRRFRQRHQLAAYGRDLGAAFQIADDLLDVEGTTEDPGKTAGKDAAAGKATMVAVLGAEMARAHADCWLARLRSTSRDLESGRHLFAALAAFVVTRRS